MVYKAKVRHCKDCPPETKRDAKYPGPRCATHNRLFRANQKQRNHELMVIKTYGIEAGEYERRYLLQGGTCAICQRATGATKRLAVDHDHQSGSVRGLLCGPCNQFVGRLRDSPDAALRMYKYLRGEIEYVGMDITNPSRKEA